MRSVSSARRLASQASRMCLGVPSFVHAPRGLRRPAFVATRIDARSARSRSAEAMSRSLWPMSPSSRHYTSAVSMSFMPASMAALITVRPTSSEGRP
jgi:hypothetical protein